jgi:hypothetical protein
MSQLSTYLWIADVSRPVQFLRLLAVRIDQSTLTWADGKLVIGILSISSKPTWRPCLEGTMRDLESPVWDSASNRLLWSDNTTDEVHAIDLADRRRSAAGISAASSAASG